VIAARHEPTSDNNAVGASARFARSGVHGAYGALERVRASERWSGTWSVGVRAWRRVANL
jgi:hypothetical protein